MLEDLQKKKTDFYVKQKMLYGGDIVVEVTLKENDKAYITNVKVPERLNNSSEWISGYWFNEKEFAKLEELCDYYGITKDGLKVLISSNGDLEKIADIIHQIEYAKVDVSKALNYMIENPSLPYTKAIINFNPYCYYNIQGEFIIIPLSQGK